MGESWYKEGSTRGCRPDESKLAYSTGVPVHWCSPNQTVTGSIISLPWFLGEFTIVETGYESISSGGKGTKSCLSTVGSSVNGQQAGVRPRELGIKTH